MKRAEVPGDGRVSFHVTCEISYGTWKTFDIKVLTEVGEKSNMQVSTDTIVLAFPAYNVELPSLSLKNANVMMDLRLHVSNKTNTETAANR